ncbi:MAG: nucleotidyltransferase domain-containing protein [Ignavibacteriae bacterium]|nr:nucleotidyltransferase domain-containing protein [Ignavibacteriota bacterium]
MTSASPPIELPRQQLQDVPEINFAFLFGSFAAGTTNDLSDIDVAVHFCGAYTLLDVSTSFLNEEPDDLSHSNSESSAQFVRRMLHLLFRLPTCS